MRQPIEALEKPFLGVEDWGFVMHGAPGTFSVEYERKAMPDFGALEYAYQSLALPPMDWTGPGIPVHSQGVAVTQPSQAYHIQSLPQYDLWLSAGAYYNQPLTDDKGNFIVEEPGHEIPPSVYRNQPATHVIDAQFWENNPFPDRRI